jgi:chemotaxis protein histidine kinase CheA
MSAEEMVVGFVQVYSASTGHRETTRKSMIWRWSDGRWRIVSEQSTKMARAAAGDVVVAPAEAELSSARAKREAELASAQADLESRQAAAKAAREAQLNAERAAREAESAANQAKRAAEAAAANARKEERRLAKELLSVAPAPAVPAAAAPATTPATLPATPPMASLTAAPHSASFEPAVRAWVKAWNDRQVDTYLAFYGPGFEVPGGHDRATWAAERRDAITRPAWIKVRADQLKTTVNGESAEARFFQVYVVAPGSVELVNKSMRWVWTDGRWQIVREESEPLVRKHAKK